MSSKDNVACVDPDGSVHFIDRGFWMVISRTPLFSKIAVSNGREVIATTASGDVYYKPQIRNTNVWQKITGSLVNIGISLYYINGCNSAGTCFSMDLRD